MTKRTIAKIPISPGTPVRVEDFRYVDQGLEWNMQNEFDLRDDHLQASRVVNWEIFDELSFGLDGWTPLDSLKLYVTANELFVTEGLCHIGGRSYVLSVDAELFDGETPANNTYNIYLKYTLENNEFAYEYTTSTRSNDHLIKYLLLATCQYTGGTGWIADPVDKRASNTALGAPATVSGSDSGPIFTVENTGSGLGLLVRLSDAQIGEDGSGLAQILTIWGTSTTGLTLKESETVNAIVLSCDASGRMKVAGDINITGTVTSGTWQGDVIANAYVANDITLDNLTQITTSDHADLTVGIGTNTHPAIDTHISTSNIHYLQSSITAVGIIGTGTWEGTSIANGFVAGLDQNCLKASAPEFAGLTLTGAVNTDDGSFEISYAMANIWVPYGASSETSSLGRVNIDISGSANFSIPTPNDFFEQQVKIEKVRIYYGAGGTGTYCDMAVYGRSNTSAALGSALDSSSQVGNGLTGDQVEEFIINWTAGTDHTLFITIDNVVGFDMYFFAVKIVWST